MFGLGGTELLVILILALLIFGSRLPSVMRSAGQSVSAFKQGLNEIADATEAERA
ncbi:MAG: twin-arginine translocase TatA/TatE family subunit [Planctomycetota bacterium]|nr:MAG: twin-arginine translocase TatA/TatE family subunit [Planctomycetota bacterium]